MAFHGGYERDSSGEPTREAMLGALMMAESQSAQLQLLESFGKFCEAWAKSKRQRQRTK